MLTTVDSWQYSRYTRFFLDFLTYLFEVDNVDVVEGDLRTLDKDLAMFPSAMDDYDLLYIDADHTLESVQRDFRFQARVRSGGYILFDDYGNSPVTEFVDFHMPQLAGFELVEKNNLSARKVWDRLVEWRDMAWHYFRRSMMLVIQVSSGLWVRRSGIGAFSSSIFVK